MMVWSKRYCVWVLVVVCCVACGRDAVLFDEVYDYEEQGRYSAAELRRLSETYRQHIDIADRELEKLQRSQRRLLRTLLTEEDAGCYLREPLQELEILIAGKRLDDLYITKHKEYNHIQSEGRGHHMRMELGEGLSFSFKIEDLVQNRPWQSEDYSHLRVSSIEYVRLAKEGQTYTPSFRFRQLGCGFLWLGNCEYYEFFESNRWQLNAVSISVAGVPLYAREGIDFDFHRHNRQWQDVNLMEGVEYQEMLRKNDCLLQEVEHRQEQEIDI